MSLSHLVLGHWHYIHVIDRRRVSISERSQNGLLSVLFAEPEERYHYDDK